MKKTCVLFLAAIATSISGAGCPNKKTASVIPPNYFAALKPENALHWGNRSYVYCIDETTVQNPAQDGAIRWAVGQWVSSLNKAISAVPIAGQPFSSQEIVCAVPGVTAIPGVHKWLVAPLLPAHTGWTHTDTHGQLILDSVSKVTTDLWAPGQPGMFDSAGYQRVALHEVGGSMGIGDPDVPAITAGEPNAMANPTEKDALSTADVVSMLLDYQGVPSS